MLVNTKKVNCLSNLKDDEDAFEVFSMYCGLGLHHAKLYDKIRRSEQKCKVRVGEDHFLNNLGSNIMSDRSRTPNDQDHLQ